MLSKKVTHKRLRDKPSSKNKKTITAEDKEYLEYLQTTDYCCMVCGTANGVEFHHVKEHSVDKKNHKRLIPLCYMHHRLDTDVSAHNAPKRFKELYPMVEQFKLADKIYAEYVGLSKNV